MTPERLKGILGECKKDASVTGYSAYAYQRITLTLGEALEEAWKERGRLRNALLEQGCVPCDIPECNCGSWHAKYGYPERMEEIRNLLAGAGHPLSNENGNLARNALQVLIQERDSLKRRIAEMQEFGL